MDNANAGLRTINDIFFLVVERQRDCVQSYRQNGRWLPIPSVELYRNVVGVAHALKSWGIGKGDRVALLSENRAEWATADFAVLGLGAIDVPIYPTLTAEQAAFILRDSGARVVFVSTLEQLKKIQSIQRDTAVEKIVAMDYGGGSAAIAMRQLMEPCPAERDPEFDATARSAQSGDLATIIYTSGTTGTPKGAMLTHHNLTANVLAAMQRFGLSPADQAISVLPLSHITARHVDYAMFYHGVPIAYCPNIDDLTQTLLEVRPTFFAGVPRIYEKARHKAEARAAHGMMRRIFDWAIATGHKHLDEIAAGKLPRSLAWKLANVLVYSKVKAGFGGRVDCPVSGGAPLGKDLAEWYAAIGMPIYEGYGLTETSPVIAVNAPSCFKIGTVGKPLPNFECRIAEDGELLVRSECVFQGYWNQPQLTAEALTPDGWFHTGDIGAIDADGFLSITDRKKDLIKTSGGKFIAPQPIENALKTNPYIAQAALIGDRRRFPSVVIAPNFPALEDWARIHGIGAASHAELVADPQVQGLYHSVIEQLNRELAQFEKIKKILIVPDEFSIATGEITPSHKLRRRVVEQKYRQQIDALYSEHSEAATERVATG
jgi:long-chain acyl-CoA synthetase